MKIGIATFGRFHVLDLARELDGLGAEVRFYSCVPRKRALRFGLPERCYRGLATLAAPAVGWHILAPRLLPRLQERAFVHALNAAVIARLEPCDAFICMSGLYLEAARFAKRRFGAKVWLERGSRHIRSQLEILRQAGVSGLPSDFGVRRELEGYALADRIVVPSRQVAESFAACDPDLLAKLFVNPYGVDLDQFPPAKPGADVPARRVLFVGGWNKRKGVDLLVDAVRRRGDVGLLHVGALGDVPFPRADRRFEHVDPVPQWTLKEQYARARVFALASREEGLAMVQVQALASGLALVCTDRTGGADLALSPGLAARIFVAAPEVEAIARALDDALTLADRPGGLVPLSESDRALLSWSAYGARYHRELEACLGPEGDA
ncbi:glycosyltransferase family 4 protein [Aquabacter spiritensis]|uniref:Glycosyltransferase involved in cell wall biosynthesis n=1 Tax=Aquabacter spiritensis TaxID=933073 RepID=A0A4R3LTR9_9HYPH|nr:glycosyltransferase family 4 protein [Aquabacter spiritensis]TCT03970.1 glycosyltransferase involved in cell wall biosynthesis [Aquabacter spiritensis]